MPKADPKSEQAQKRRKLYGVALLAAIGLFQAHAQGLTESLAQGQITSQAWAASYVQILIDLHSQASLAGRGVGSTIKGTPAPTFGFTDQTTGLTVAVGQSPYVADFRRDIEQGRYDNPETGLLDPERCIPRINLYANRARGTANDACIGTLDREDGIYWRLSDGEGEKHCKTCPAWAAGGPYTRFSLPAVPGDGKSDCGTNCLCHLEINEIPIPMLARPRAFVA